MSPSYWVREWQPLPQADLKLLSVQELEELVADGMMLLTQSDLSEFNRDYPNADL